ncbi:MAG: potassium/proton antiporter [Caldimonas sp.]|uniref:potassium/proton antiporter n=1 Tax=Caldimonas sp. TaxID=2838790 RepID=UPI003919711A
MDFNFINVPLLIASALLLSSVLAGMLSARAGFSFLLIFLIAGGLAGEDGPGGLKFSDFTLSFWVGNVALAVILLDGGLRTSLSTFRTGLKPSLLLATVGVLITAMLTGLGAMLLLDLPWQQGLLLGAIVGSTDAAAVFALLKTSGVQLNERVAATLEIESGMNDPMAVFLTMAFISLITAAPEAGSGWAMMLWSFVQQFGLGTLIGVGAGFLMSEVVHRLPRQHAGGGIMGLLLAASGLLVFSLTGMGGGSGFLAIYLFGMVLGNRGGRRVRAAFSAMDGYAWLSQAIMFLLLGLLVTPSGLLDSAWPALGVSAILMLVARPMAVWLCLAPFRFAAREVWFISWVGLRGAVPIVLAIFPLMAGVSHAMLLFQVAFVVVLVSLVLQGTTIGWAGRRFGVALPDRDDEELTRAVFGDFVLDGHQPTGLLCEFYGLPAVPDAHLPLSEWVARRLGRPAVVGDRVPLGEAVLSVREMDGPRIRRLGLSIPLRPAGDEDDAGPQQ